MGVQVLSDFAFYAHSCFRVEAVKVTKALAKICRRLRRYWDSKGDKPYFSFDE